MHRAPSHSRKIATMLAWEFWARGWQGIVLAPLGALVLPSLIFGTMSWQYSTPFRDTEVGNLLQFSFYWMTLILLGPTILTALGNPKLRYTLPASSFLLVAAPMACAMATAFVQYAIVATSMNALFDVGWSIWGPGLLAAVLVAWYQAVLWSISSSVGLQVLACSVSSAPLLVAIKVWGPPDGPMMAVLSSVGTWHILLFAVAATVCFGVGTLGFAKVRSGAGFDVKSIVDVLSRVVFFPRRSHRRPFSSPTSAQFWLEWTERGFALPVGTALIGLVLLVLAFFVPAKDGSDFLGAFSVFVLAPLSVIGMFFGSRSSRGEFGNFNGSRPLSDRQLAGAILKSSTLSLISSAVIWAVFLALVVWVVGEHRETSKLYRAIQHVLPGALAARIVLGAVVVWSTVGLLTSLTLSGRRVLGVALLLIFGAWAAGFLFPLCLRPEFRHKFTDAYTVVCLALCLVAVAATFIASWRRQLIFMPTLLLAAIIVLTAVAAWHFSVYGLAREGKYLLPILCGCGLTPIPLAAAPLAVFVNRHR